MKDIYKILDVIVDRLDDVLKQKDWTMTDLARDMGIPSRTLTSWMRKTRVPKIDAIWFLADYLKISIDYLIGREN